MASGEFCQIPNILFDEFMSEVGGTEFKCLCVIIRKTLGWNKTSDAISISQFRQHTGIKKAETIQKSLQALVRNGLILADKAPGRVTRYSLSSVMHSPRKTVLPEMGGTTGNGAEPPPKMGRRTAPENGGAQNTTQNTTRQNTCKDSQDFSDVETTEGFLGKLQ